MKKILLKVLIVLFVCNQVTVNAQWTSATVNGNTGVAMKQSFFASNLVAFVAANSGTIYKSTDGGVNWNILSTTIDNTINLNSITFSDENNGIVVGDLGKIYKTTDGGSTWVEKTSGTTQNLLGVVLLSNNTTVFAYGSGGVILKSSDAGENWSSSPSPTTQANRGLAFAPSNENIAYLVGDNAGGSTSVYKSTDGAMTWSTQTLPTSTDGDPVNLFGISLVDDNNVFVCGGSKRISKTSTGSSWTNINSAFANFYRSAVFTSSTSGYVVGQGGKILKTINGSTFTLESTTVTETLNHISNSADGTYIVVGSSGSILRMGSVATNVAPVATDDNGGTIQENGADGTVNILTNDTDADGNPSGTSGHTVDLDFITPGIQTTITSPIDQSVWSYNTSTGLVTCNPAANFDGSCPMIYSLCDAGGLCDNATITFIVQNTTGVTENNLISKVYPNPVKDILTIETSSKVNKIAVLGLDGKEIATYKVESKINVSNLNAGIYFLAVTAENGLVSKTKFIKE